MISYRQKEQWFDHFSSVSLEESYEMCMNLLDENIPDDELIEDDFGTISVELKSELIQEKQYEKAINLIEKIKSTTTKLYRKEFPYLSEFAVEYYLFKKKYEKANAHLEPFIKNPDHGYDMFLPLFDKIRFYQMDDLAIKLANQLYKPIKESPELIGGAEFDLLDVIFYHIFQELYEKLEKNEEIDIQQLKATFKKYEYDDTFLDKDFPEIYHTLKTMASRNGAAAFTKNEWTHAVHDNAQNAIKTLFWSFAVYMLKRGKFHFSLSTDIWFPFFNMLLERETLQDFKFGYQDVDELTGKFFGFMSNKKERGFALTWGVPYIYDFLFEQELVGRESYDEALRHIDAIKKRLRYLYKEDLWRFDFVHTWVKPLSVSEESFAEEEQRFQKTFLSPPRKTFSSPSAGSKKNIFDDLFNEENNRPKKPKAAKKKARKQASKQRKKNRKK
ncbi:hypothetical protein [Siminovitchia sp. 179-K 8D1 HS]|uniref:hypothetical protein n=1 Tax=Siminovitchia sp. 179-K 8D1 HS TaxID=3142385 RepID=UPI0039A053C6